MVSRLNDIGIGICTDHKNPLSVIATIMVSSNNRNTNSLGNARVKDILICTCGHVSEIKTGSSKLNTNNKKQSKLTSTFSGSAKGTIMTGSPNKFCI